MNKEEVRRQLKKTREEKTELFVNQKTEKIHSTLYSFSLYNQSSSILFYISFNNEVNTHPLIKKALSQNKHVLVPVSEPKTHTLKISRLMNFADLSPGTYGILEPKKENRIMVSIDQIDLIIVPGVGFDEQGHRIGQGGGYYDWLLSKSKAPSIALAFEFQMQKNIPIEPHDQTVQYIITEDRIITCS